MSLIPDSHWCPVRDGDAAARALYRRHYSCRSYRDYRRQKKIVGPGEYVLMITADESALFCWKRFIDGSGQRGVCCSIFRNEGPCLSSALIREACDIAWRRWPGARLYTYVNRRKVQSRNPGYCFQCASWRRAGRTKGGLLVFEILPQVLMDTGPGGPAQDCDDAVERRAAEGRRSHLKKWCNGRRESGRPGG